MKRFVTISPFGQSTFDYELPPDEFGESVTDDSYFVPSSEAIKGLSGVLTEKEVQMYYDFPDGKDTGQEVPLARKQGVDISEVSTDIRARQDKLKKQVKDAKEREDFNRSLQEKYAPKLVAPDTPSV